MCSNLVIILNHKSFVSSEHTIYRQLVTVFCTVSNTREIQDSKSFLKMPYESFVGYSTSYKVPTLFVDVYKQNLDKFRTFK